MPSGRSISHFPIFTIPIYRVDEETYYGELEADKQREIKEILQHLRAGTPAYENAKQYINGKYSRGGRQWYLNQIVGWLTLIRSNSQLRADLYYVDLNRIPRHFAKRDYAYVDQYLLMDMTPDIQNTASPAEIFSLIVESLQNLIKDLKEPEWGGKKLKKPVSRYRRRYFDIQQFMNIGNFLDWRRIFDLG